MYESFLGVFIYLHPLYEYEQVLRNYLTYFFMIQSVLHVLIAFFEKNLYTRIVQIIVMILLSWNISHQANFYLIFFVLYIVSQTNSYPRYKY